MREDAEDFVGSLTSARSGDRLALERLLVPELPGLLAFIRLRTGAALRRRESLSDILQSVCRDIVADLPGLREETADGFRRWIYAVALNRIQKKHRFHAAARRDAARELPFDTAVGEADVLASYAGIGTPSRGAIAREEIARIEAAFDALPGEQREALLMARFEGLSHAEIGARLARSPAAVAQCIARAKASLARRLVRP